MKPDFKEWAEKNGISDKGGPCKVRLGEDGQIHIRSLWLSDLEEIFNEAFDMGVEYGRVLQHRDNQKALELIEEAFNLMKLPDCP